MATDLELFSLMNNSTLRNRVQVACLKVAESVASESDATPNHSNRLLWAKAVFNSPTSEARRMFLVVLAANSALDVSAIVGASEAAILANIESHIDLFADGS